jgi:hypothetical protein
MMLAMDVAAVGVSAVKTNAARDKYYLGARLHSAARTTAQAAL